MKEEKHYYCKFCGKEILGKERYRKQFCNRSCAASYNNLGKVHKNETKKKISDSLRKRYGSSEKKEVKKEKKAYIPFDRTKEYFCEHCGKKIENVYSSKSNRFCSEKCRHRHTFEKYIRKWKSGEESGLYSNGYTISKHIRDYLFEKNNNKCEICGWGEVNLNTNKIPLQIHHKDGNCQNNNEDNLQLLCPNCHSLTDNFGSRNKNGTKGRSEYFGRKKMKS